MAHGLCGSLTSFLGARFALGFSEAAVFPASLKAVAEWFPAKRACARGWDLQRWIEPGSDHYTASRTLDRGALGLALGISVSRVVGVCLACVLVVDVSNSWRTPSLFGQRIGVHSQRRSRISRQTLLEEVDSSSADLGVRAGKVLSPIRSGGFICFGYPISCNVTTGWCCSGLDFRSSPSTCLPMWAAWLEGGFHHHSFAGARP